MADPTDSLEYNMLSGAICAAASTPITVDVNDLVAALANLRSRSDGWERLAKARGRMAAAKSPAEFTDALVDEGKAISALAVAGVADPRSLDVTP